MREESPVVVFISGRIDPPDIPVLCERALVALCEDRGCVLVCDVRGIVAPDAVAVDALARLQLLARRAGAELRLQGATERLIELLEMAGLCDVLPCGPALRVEPGREPEQREDPGRVEEEHDPGDPPV